MTGAEFSQFEQRMNERFDTLSQKIEALADQVTVVGSAQITAATLAAGKKWFGPRGTAAVRRVGVIVGGALLPIVGWAIKHYIG